MVRDLAWERERECHLTLEGGETVADKRILEELKDPLMHLIRNAIDHGIEPPAERRTKGKPAVGTIVLRASQSVGQVVVEVEDDGRGLDLERIRQSASKSRRWRLEDLATMPVEQLQELIFVSGLSTSNFVSDVSGRGVGLDVVRTNVERLKGTISVASRPGGGTIFRIRVPVTLVTARVVVVSAGGLKYALPMEFIAQSLLLRRNALFTLEGLTAIQIAGEPVAVARLADLLALNRNDFLAGAASNQQPLPADERLSCLIIKVDGERFALLVDELSEDREVMIKPTGDFLEQIPGISGTIILGSGEVCPVLQPRDLLPALGRQKGLAGEEGEAEAPAEKKLLLLVEDSLTTRTRMKRILEGGGYEVVTAVDGVNAMSKLGTRRFDGLVSDISMPHMDGLTLTARVRQLKRYAELPISLVTMLASEEDKKRGLEAGANAYITKPAFDQKLLLDTLRRLV
jgi:two-component system chemotaxis sensor kinase CheA